MQGNTLKEGIMGDWTTVVGTGTCSRFQTCFKVKKRESFQIVKQEDVLYFLPIYFPTQGVTIVSGDMSNSSAQTLRGSC